MDTSASDISTMHDGGGAAPDGPLLSEEELEMTLAMLRGARDARRDEVQELAARWQERQHQAASRELYRRCLEVAEALGERYSYSEGAAGHVYVIPSTDITISTEDWQGIYARVSRRGPDGETQYLFSAGGPGACQVSVYHPGEWEALVERAHAQLDVARLEREVEQLEREVTTLRRLLGD